MAYANPLTKFPLHLSPPGSANTASPNRPLASIPPVQRYTPVGTVTHAPHMQLTPMSGKVNFRGR